MNQTISKKNLKVIYLAVCQRWQKTLQDILLWSEGSEVELSNELILKGYNEADENQKKLIKKYFKIEDLDITSKVKNFKDILKLSGKTLKEILPYQKPIAENQVKLNALAKIQLIEEVLNQGWKPTWNNFNEYKYYPYFELQKVGFAFDGSAYGFQYYDGAVACYQNKKISDFVGKTFISEYREFSTGKL